MEKCYIIFLKVKVCSVVGKKILKGIAGVKRGMLGFIIKIVLGDSFVIVSFSSVGIRKQFICLINFYETFCGILIPRLIRVPRKFGYYQQFAMETH